jgi:tetratricopeptide (TPR) repeat protein
MFLKRFYYPFAFTLTVLLLTSLAYSQERVEYKRDGKSTVVVGQVVEEGISGIKVKPTAGKETTVAPNEVLKVVYEFPPALRPEVNPIFLLEEKKDYAKALDEYKKVVDKVKNNPNASDRAKRYIEYRLAMLKVVQNEKDAADTLSNFLKAHANSWEYPAAAKQLVALQLSTQDYDSAIKTASALASSSGLPKDMKQEADLMLIDVQFQAGKYSEVQNKIGPLLTSIPASDPMKKKLEVFQIAVSSKDAKIEDLAAQLTSIIDSTNDSSLKALAFNTLGDCYSSRNQKREAMWQYLWVDSVYNSDVSERVKALDRLAKLFETEFKEPERAKAFREKAQRLR